MPLPVRRCRVQFFFFGSQYTPIRHLGPIHAEPGWLVPIRSVLATKTDRFRLYWCRTSRFKPKFKKKKKKKGAKRTVWLYLQVLSLHRVICWYRFMLLLFCLSCFLVNWVLFEFLLLYMWKKFVLYTVEFWVSWNLRERVFWIGWVM